MTVSIRNTREENFKKEIVNFTDEHYKLATDIYNQFGNYGPIIVSKEDDTLSFGVNLATNRVDKEIGTNLYKIKIIKIK
jgi:hypothetical protein